MSASHPFVAGEGTPLSHDCQASHRVIGGSMIDDGNGIDYARSEQPNTALFAGRHSTQGV